MKTLKILLILLSNAGLLLSQNGWYQVPSNTNAWLREVKVVSSSAIFAAGLGYTIVKSTDQGNSWLVKYSGQNFYNFYSIDFVNENTGYACGAFEQNTPPYTIFPKIFKTTNSGENWSELNASQISGKCNKIICVNDSILFCSSTFALYRSTNSGITWSGAQLPNYSAIQFVNSQTGFAYENPGIKKTTDAGYSWQTVSQTPGGSTFISMRFISDQIGYILGRSSSHFIIKTTDSGSNWSSPVIFENTMTINDMNCPGLDTIFLCGSHTSFYNYGRIIRTSNAGSNWETQYEGASYAYTYSIDFLNALTGVSVGPNGLIIRTASGGLTPVNQVHNYIPSKFYLSQNFPNPFNPVTSISFDIPNSSFTKLIVFDQLGREVDILVNEQLSPGSYKYEWNAADYPSGIYFYKLQAGDFVETKKMVLVK